MSEYFEMRRTMRFEAAHHLPHTPQEHKCHRLHGHSFAVEVTVSGELIQPEGWIMDFGELGDLLGQRRRATAKQSRTKRAEGRWRTGAAEAGSCGSSISAGARRARARVGSSRWGGRLEVLGLELWILWHARDRPKWIKLTDVRGGQALTARTV